MKVCNSLVPKSGFADEQGARLRPASGNDAGKIKKSENR